MNPKLKILLRLLVIFIVLIIIIQPYNTFCNLTSKCQALGISSFIPNREGKVEAKINFGVKSYLQGLEIKPEQPSLITVSGRKNTINYIAKNNAGHFVRFRMEFFVMPEQLKEHIKLYQCPCSGQKRLKKGGEQILTAEFSISDEGIELINQLQKINDEKGAEGSNEQIGVIGFEVIPF